MVTVTKYAGTITQTTGGKFRTFENLNNMKMSSTGTYAESNGLIKGKSGSPNRPSTLTFTQFGFNIPSGALVKKVIVEYRYSKVAYNGKVCNIPAPTITLLNLSGFSGKINAPTTVLTNGTKSFYVDTTASKINSNNFGVKVDFPTNTNEYQGYMRINFVRIQVEYVDSVHTCLVDVYGNYNKENSIVTVHVLNQNMTPNNPTVTITVPAGFNFVKSDGEGILTQTDTRTFSWNPQLSRKPRSSISLNFIPDVTYPTGTTSFTGTITASESYKGTSATRSVTITDRPVTPGTDESGQSPQEESVDADTIDGEYTIKVAEDEVFKIDVDLSTVDWTKSEVWVFFFKDTMDWYSFRNHSIDYESYQWGELDYKYGELADWESLQYQDYVVIDESDLDENNCIDFEFKCPEMNGSWYSTAKGATVSNEGYYFLHIIAVDVDPLDPSPVSFEKWVKVNVRPTDEDLGLPQFCFFKPDEEELKRLGDGYTYNVTSYMKVVSTEDGLRDWKVNNRLAVFNNAVEPNVYHTLHYEHTSDRFDTEISLPRHLNLTGCTLKLVPNRAMYINSIIAEWQVREIPLGDTYNVPVFFRRFAHPDVTITSTVVNSDNETLYTFDIVVNFLASATREPYETIVDSTDYNHLTKETIVNNAGYLGNTVDKINTYEIVECEFRYNPDYPLYILVIGDYTDTASTPRYDTTSLKFAEPAIIEQNKDYQGWESNGNFPVSIDDMILQDGSFSTVTLGSLSQSNPFIVYDFPLEEGYGTTDDFVIRGITIEGTIESTDNFVLYGKLKSPNGEMGQRSIILEDVDINDDDRTFRLGGTYDLWGFSPLDMLNLEDWEVELQVSNLLNNTEGFLNFGGVRIILTAEEITHQPITCKINDENLAYYGAFIQKVKVPEGLDTDTDFLTIDGTDTNDSYRQNIREKEIEIEFDIGECDLTSSTQNLQQVTKLFVNKRDEYNRPIPKRIWFSKYPDVYWEYVMEKAFDVEEDIGAYSVKAKLTVPAGTSYNLEDTVTNTFGYVSGLAAVRPVITFAPTGEDVVITENISNQSFHMAYSGEWQDSIVEIDCDNRKVYLLTDEDDINPTDISRYVDINSDWFRLSGEYSFTGTNATVRTVTYNERW